MNAVRNVQFVKESLLRITIFVILSSLVYTVRNYPWAVTILVCFALYSLLTGVYRLYRKE